MTTLTRHDANLSAPAAPILNAGGTEAKGR